MKNNNALFAVGALCCLVAVGYVAVKESHEVVESGELQAVTQSVGNSVTVGAGTVCVKYSNNSNTLFNEFDGQTMNTQGYLTDLSSRGAGASKMSEVFQNNAVLSMNRPLKNYTNYARGTNLYVIQSTPAQVNSIVSTLSQDAGVEYVESCAFEATTFVEPNDPELVNQWHHDNEVDIPGAMTSKRAWELADIHSASDNSVTVVVADTGVSPSHVDLVNRVVGGGGNGNHGTHVGGIVAAEGNNAEGVVGVAGLQDGVSIVNASLCNMMQAAAILGGNPGVVNHSCGMSGMGSAWKDAAKAVTDNGGAVIAAAGNNNKEPKDVLYKYPCAEEFSTDSGVDAVYCVGSTTSSNSKSHFSNYGPTLTFSAPGSSILSTCVGGGYCVKHGTSMAAPNAAGSVAFLMSLGASAQTAVSVLESTADTINTSVDMGAGRIDLCEATASYLNVSNSYCTTGPVCGNGVVEGNEECDDANAIDGDGCESCVIVTYPNGDECLDDGACESGNCEEISTFSCVSGAYGEKLSCPGFTTIESCLGFQQNAGPNGELVSVCAWEETVTGICSPLCGNGLLETGEECDDGNTVNGDGCDSICVIEPVCTEDYSTVDYNNDGRLSAADLVELSKVINGLIQCPIGKICDINGDGSVDQGDIQIIQDYILGIINGFEICGDGIDNNCDGLIDNCGVGGGGGGVPGPTR